MGFLRALLAGATAAFVQSTQTPIRVWITIALVVAAAYLLLRIAAALAWFALSPSAGAPRGLRIKSSEEEGRCIWLNATARKNLGLSDATYVLLRRTRHSRGVLVEVLQRNRGTSRDPGDDGIEMTPEVRNRLRIGFNQVDGEPVLLYVRERKLAGFSEYWFNPDNQVRFTNRLAIAMGIGVPLFQLLLDWSR